MALTVDCLRFCRCLATFGLTSSNIMDDDSDISGDKWDVYSLAVVLSFLFSEQHPYSGLRDAKIVRGVVEDGLRPETVCVCVCVRACVRACCDGGLSFLASELILTLTKTSSF